MANTSAAADLCTICLGELGRGQTLITADCSHVFHLHCFSDNASKGRRDCPVCKATWRDVPVIKSDPTRPYADDDPVAPVTGAQAQAAGTGEVATAAPVTLKTHCELPAVPRGESRDRFAVLVHATAPEATAEAADAQRAPLDLVTVLDVSGSMTGNKLALVKQAMGFVIDNLGPADRLSVVSFSHSAARHIRLTRMSADGKAAAKRAVESLAANGSTNIRKGLDVAAQVLGNRRYRNPVTSIILLSDGQDTCGNRGINLMPPSLREQTGAGERPAPVHTFGFGTDHDAASMHLIAENTRGTFSYIVKHAVIQDSFAQCIGGLLSVAMQNVRIALTCLHPGVFVREVKSGIHQNSVDADGRAASVEVGDLYANETRRFLVFVDVPAADDVAEVNQTPLISVRCSYRDAATGRDADVAGEDAVVRRPVELLEGDDKISLEVEREKIRVAAAEDMAAARAAAERGQHSEAARRLRNGRATLKVCALIMKKRASIEEDEECDDLEEEMEEMEGGVADQNAYLKFGRARLLSSMNMHRIQRAAFCGASIKQGRRFKTKAMDSMVKKSKKARGASEESALPTLALPPPILAAPAPAPGLSKKAKKSKKARGAPEESAPAPRPSKKSRKSKKSKTAQPQ